jgi:hypothetical protein
MHASTIAVPNNGRDNQENQRGPAQNLKRIDTL